jgi:hypothetical protein
MLSNIVDGVIYVLDSSDIDTFSTSKKYLNKFL